MNYLSYKDIDEKRKRLKAHYVGAKIYRNKITKSFMNNKYAKSIIRTLSSSESVSMRVIISV